MTLVLYYFQNCLGESAETPNAFYLPPGDTTFGTFLTHFPVKDSNLHFRVKFSDPTHGFIWKDLFSRSEVLPLFQDAIFLKILRHDRALIEKQLRVLALQKSLDAKGVTSAPAKSSSSESQKNNSSPAPRKPSTPVSSSSGNINPIQPPPSAAAAAPSPDAVSPSPSLTRQPSVDMLDFGSSPASKKAPGGSSAAAGTSSFSNSAAALDIDTAAGPKLTRDELAQRRQDGIEEKVQAALDFKAEMDAKAAREAAEVDSAREKHDKVLTQWAMANAKEKRNVRTLLSTMHSVLWKESGWKPLGLGDVIEAKKVKLNYRKAMLVVHPDRCSNLDSETKFIAKRIFEAINEAYDEFLKKENV